MKKIKPLLKIIAIAIWLLFIINVGKFFMADFLYQEAQTQSASADYKLALNTINNAIKNNPNEPSYYRDRARIYLALSLRYPSDTTFIKTLKNVASSDLEYAIKLNPQNHTTLRNIVQLYYFLAVKDPYKGDQNVDEDFIEKTKNYFNELKTAYPNDAGLYVSVAKYEKKLGLMQEYEDTITRIKVLRPDLLQWHPDLVQ
jgi:tetratricopeptide (TPR) repeat protein